MTQDEIALRSFVRFIILFVGFWILFMTVPSFMACHSQVNFKYAGCDYKKGHLCMDWSREENVSCLFFALLPPSAPIQLYVYWPYL